MVPVETEVLYVRIPPGLKDKLKAEADRNCRSLNQQLAYILFQRYRRSQRSGEKAQAPLSFD